MRFKLLKNKTVIILGLVIGILLFQSIFMQSWIKIERGFNMENGEEENLKGSDYWVLPNSIHVDNNWSLTASTYGWCSGSGTIGSPYIIENVTIDAQNSGSCIYIQNTNDYFIIQNCTLINSQASPNSAIRMSSVSNGKIIDNNCTNNNGRAISLFSASKMLVEDNNLVNNGYGVTLSYCYDSVVSKNYIQDSDFYGIYLWDSDNNIITENEVNHNGFYAGGYHGIYISESGSPSYVDSINNTIKHNNVNNNRKSGIYINSCNNNTIFGNFIENNLEYGIRLYYSDDVNIVGNKLNDNNLGCITTTSSLNTKEEWNACNDIIDPFIIDETGGGNFTWGQVSQFAWCSGLGSYTDPYILADLSIDAQSTGSCILIEHSYDKYFIISGCTVINAEASGGEAGIKLNWVHNGTIIQNTCMDNYIGIYLLYSENITISQNDVIDNLGQGIVVYQSKRNFIVDNDQMGSWYYGLMVITLSDNNTIRGNTFRNNTGVATHGDGIRILGSDDNKIVDNILINNDRGIKIEQNSHNNTITQNVIQNNTNYGALVLANTQESHDNLFYLNTFNNPLGQNAYDNGTNTNWDNGTIGNYWENYSGIDADDDGIGDIPHPIPGNGGGQDNFPIWEDGDDSPPIITINQPNPYDLFGTIAPLVDVIFTCPKLSATWYQLDGTIITSNYSWIGTIDQSVWDQVGNGTVTLLFYANNTVGKEALNSVTVRKDSIAPTININSPTLNELFGTSAPNFNVEIYDVNLDTMWYTLDNGLTNTTFTSNGTINQALWSALPDGNVIIRFYANDSAGNIGFAEVTINKDVTAPIITFNNPQNSDVIGATAPNFNISIDELNLDKTWYSLNGGNNVTFTGFTGTINQALWDALSEGNVIIRFYANDTLGRIGFQEVTVVKLISQSNSPGIPGYNIVLLLGIVSTIAIIIVKKRLNHLN